MTNARIVSLTAPDTDDEDRPSVAGLGRDPAADAFDQRIRNFITAEKIAGRQEVSYEAAFRSVLDAEGGTEK